MSTHILIIEDDLTFSTMLSAWLRKKNFQVTTTSSVAAAIKLLLQAEHAPQLILSDLRLPDHDGLYLLQWLHSKQLFIPFIMMTSYAEVQNAVEAMKLGATDYISKPIQPDLLLQKINEALSASTQTVSNANASQTDNNSKAHPTSAKGKTASPSTSTVKPHPGIEGHSPIAQELYRLASLVAPTPMSVLIIGASGTGKEYVAHRIHEQSTRAMGPFIAMDCGALTKELALSQLFGHTKGAFTGATDNKIGAFEQASGGTLFLDEVGNLSYDVQVQLLRALQERCIRPVGSTEERPINIRLVCATNENLPQAIQHGSFREDLYHRINEFTLRMPLLRERGTDILEFARYFLKQANTEIGRNIADFTTDAQQALLHYPWPGNLREMRNVVVRAALLAEDAPYLSAAQLCLPQATTAQPTAGLSMKPTADEELARIHEALQLTGGNKSRAAQLLGIDRKTLYNKLKQCGE